jgi:hypothetical protein
MWYNFKKLGTRYAIIHGAETIYDMDDDNILKSKEHFKVPNMPLNDLMLVDIPFKHNFSTYNPYIKLGAPHLPSWPRGLPLDQIKNDATWDAPLVRIFLNTSRIGLIQSLADSDPDVDAIFRLTRPIPFNFSPPEDAAPILLPPKTLAPLNAQACIFTKSAFWMLLLPISVHGRVSDIWRGYAGQRLLWDIGQKILFSPPMVNQFRNPHNYIADLNSELPLYEKSNALVTFLRSWSSQEKTLTGRIEELMIQLYSRDFIGIQDVYLSQKWLASLLDAGYVFPTILKTDFNGESTPAVSPGVKSCYALPDLELFMPLAATTATAVEVRDLFARSYDFFW